MKKTNTEIIKWQQVYEYEDCITIFKYQKKNGKTNIYEVEIKYKK